MRAVLGKMQLKASHVLQACRVGGAPEEHGKVLDRSDVALLGLRRYLADRHVFDHAPPQRAHGLVGHGDAPVLSEGCQPLISRQDAPSRYRVGCVARSSALPRERFSPVAPFGPRAMSVLRSLLGVNRTYLRQPISAAINLA